MSGAIQLPRRAFWLILPVVYVLYFYGLSDVGLIGPDEPRYASIGRDMARTGDWVTPRLWGEPWFEKPALLYWMNGVSALLRLGPDLSPRLPVAVLSVAFLAFFWWWMRREFGERAAWFAALILATCGGWLGFSSVGATDLPLSATFAAALLLAVPWAARGDAARLPAAAACLGAAVLAKGLVPLVLIVPVLWFGRRHWRDLFRAPVCGAFLLVAGPWYVLCYVKNGWEFFNQFILQHHLSRFTSDALQHRQPWWFYLPVLIAGFLPWTPLLLRLPRAGLLADARTRLLLAAAAWGLLFFSASANKLPGYVLPLLPAMAALSGIALDRAARARLALAACAALLVLYPVAAHLIAPALAEGLSRATLPAPHWSWLLPLPLAAAVWWLEAGGRRVAAVLMLTAASACGVFYLKRVAYPEIDEHVSARSLWRRIEPVRDRVCVEDSLHRSLRYGLNYYAGGALPDCDLTPRPVRLARPSDAVLDLHSPAVVPSPFRN